MYFGEPGTYGTSVPSERLFSKAGEVVAATRSNIKPKNVDMILLLNKKLNVFWHCAVINFIEFFWFVWGRGAVSSGTVSYRNTSAWYHPCASKNQPPLTISIPSFDSLIQLYVVQSFPKTSISCNSSSQVQSRFAYFHLQGFIQPYDVFKPAWWWNLRSQLDSVTSTEPTSWWSSSLFLHFAALCSHTHKHWWLLPLALAQCIMMSSLLWLRGRHKTHHDVITIAAPQPPQ